MVRSRRVIRNSKSKIRKKIRTVGEAEKQTTR